MVFRPLPARIVIEEQFDRSVKRERELGVYAALRQAPQAVEEAELREAETWLAPRKIAIESGDAVPRALRGLGEARASANRLHWTAVILMTLQLLVAAVNSAIDGADWAELALIFRQLETWHAALHNGGGGGAERPWWELQVATSNDVAEVVDVASDPVVVDAERDHEREEYLEERNGFSRSTGRVQRLWRPLPYPPSHRDPSSRKVRSPTARASQAVGVHSGALPSLQVVRTWHGPLRMVQHLHCVPQEAECFGLSDV